MNRLMIVAVLLLPALLASWAQTTPAVAGTWAVAYEVAGTSLNTTCVIKEAEEKLTGTCTGDDKIAHALTGEVKGQSITFKFDKEYSGTPITDTFTAPQGVEAGKMKGTMTVAPLNLDDIFTATKE